MRTLWMYLAYSVYSMFLFIVTNRTPYSVTNKYYCSYSVRELAPLLDSSGALKLVQCHFDPGVGTRPRPSLAHTLFPHLPPSSSHLLLQLGMS